ncbi:tetratricopeptide repeat protein [Sinorhizobium sp. RAC02]|uniref:tetratricopeptide repeat protein n=1 Tax=Sinorhizobium sp. RAC02 TaxID=1842534 RepID=UPI0012375061|nr:tetratricopeptide repeat protein [Sinorhizobium sp. RAC02]
MSGVAGNFMHDALKEAGPTLGASLLRRHTEIDRNHHIVLALRLSHLDALNAILDRFDAGRKSEIDPARKAEGARISALLRAYAKDARQFDGEAAKDIGSEERRVLIALPAAFETALAGRTGSAADANIVRREMELAVVQGLAKEIGDDLPAFLAAAFHGNAEGRDGWHDLFVRAACARLKDNAAFGAIWSAELQAGSYHRIRALLDLTAAIDRKTDQLLAGQNATEEAAERRHRENLAFQQKILDATAREKGVSVADLRPVLTRLLGHSDVPLDQIGRVLGEAVDAMLAQSQTLAVVHNDEPSIDRAINLSRAKLKTLDIEGALATVRAAQRAEEQTAQMRDKARARLFFEEADILAPLYDHVGVIAALRAALALDAEMHWRWFQLGDELVTIGARREAEANYRKALMICQSAQDQREVGVCYNRIGDMRRDEGDAKGASDVYGAALKIAKALAEGDPNNTDWQRDLSISYHKIGDMRRAEGNAKAALDAFTEDLKIAKALAERDPDNSEWLRDLSVSYNRVGDMRHAEGDSKGALDAYSHALKIRETLIERDPNNAGWRRDLSISYHKIGDMRRAEGNAKATFEAYEEALQIARMLAERDPHNAELQRDLIVSHNRIGDMLRDEGDAQGALDVYGEALKIAKTLTHLDPSNTEWQHDLAVSHHKIGNMRRAGGDTKAALEAFDEAFKIATTLVERDPSSTIWQRNLSVSYNSIGDIRLGQDDVKGALEAYDAALKIRETLVEHDPGNAIWQRDLAVGYHAIGDIRRKTGDVEIALKVHVRALKITKALADRDPDNALWQRDLIISLVKLAQADPSSAAARYAAALTIAERLAAEGKLTPADAWMPEDLAQRLAEATGASA